MNLGLAQWGLVLEFVGFLLFSISAFHDILRKGWKGRADLMMRAKYNALAPSEDDYQEELADLEERYKAYTVAEVVGALMFVIGLGFQFIGIS